MIIFWNGRFVIWLRNILILLFGLFGWMLSVVF